MQLEEIEVLGGERRLPAITWLYFREQKSLTRIQRHFLCRRLAVCSVT
jgi:hypothetical protein